MRHRRVVSWAVAATLPLLVACSSGIDDQEPVTVPSTDPGPSVAVTSGPATPSPTPSSLTSDPDSPTPSADDDSKDTAVDRGLNAAIGLAERETRGTAFEIDNNDDDDGWAVQVAVDGREVEVEVNLAGTTVLSTERDERVEREDADGLAAAEIGLAEAIERAVAEYDGDANFDDAGISRERDRSYTWEVGFTDDTDIHVKVTDGSVLRVER